MEKLNKTECKDLAKTLPDNEAVSILEKAKELIPDWTIASRDNKGLSRGSCWNILFKEYKEMLPYSEIFKYRVLRELGEYISNKYRPVRSKKQNKPPVHHDPQF